MRAFSSALAEAVLDLNSTSFFSIGKQKDGSRP